MHALLLALSLLPQVQADAEVAHYPGLGPLRGTIRVGVDLQVVRGDGWHFDIWTAARSFVRKNRENESPVRISPLQIWYPVGARFRFDLGGDREWGVFAFHQSNHDIDSADAQQARETVAYEVYGAEYWQPHLHVHGGLYYDRGTRLSGRPQTLPFDYYLAGATVEGDWPITPRWYTAGQLTLIGHLNEAHAPAHLNVAGHLDVGAWWQGDGGVIRTFLRAQRVEDYQRLGDDPVHMLLIGVGIGSRLR